MRSDKAEEEVAELMKKAEQLEVELDKTKEELVNNMILHLDDDGDIGIISWWPLWDQNGLWGDDCNMLESLQKSDRVLRLWQLSDWKTRKRVCKGPS